MAKITFPQVLGSRNRRAAQNPHAASHVSHSRRTPARMNVYAPAMRRGAANFQAQIPPPRTFRARNAKDFICQIRAALNRFRRAFPQRRHSVNLPPVIRRWKTLSTTSTVCPPPNGPKVPHLPPFPADLRKSQRGSRAVLFQPPIQRQHTPRIRNVQDFISTLRAAQTVSARIPTALAIPQTARPSPRIVSQSQQTQHPRIYRARKRTRPHRATSAH